MPRTTTVECPGCPPLRALTFDALGLIKVTESRGNSGGIPQVVERWGDADSSKCVLAASIDDRANDPVCCKNCSFFLGFQVLIFSSFAGSGDCCACFSVALIISYTFDCLVFHSLQILAVARKNGTIEISNPLSGDIFVSISDFGDGDGHPEDDDIAGLHIFKKSRSVGSCSLLTCTTKGNASLRSVDIAPTESTNNGASNSWKVCAAGKVLCAKVHGSEKHALFGGKGVEVNLWDLESSTKIWAAKPPPKNSLDIFTPTWFTSATFLTGNDHRKFVAGTNSHQVRVYDTSAQRRPVISFDFRETPIKSVAEDHDGYTIYVGNGSGDLASIDTRTGKLLGCFLGKCSGSIRSIARHPDHPVIASCGLDSYLRLWDVKTRELLSATFLKQHLTCVVFDSNFSDKEVVAPDAQNADEIPGEVEQEALKLVKRKKFPEEMKGKKKKSKDDRSKKSKKKCCQMESKECDDS
ncbi:unnamed protein product [Linum tenue]|uniref:Transducin/WD40 repeat-like superfamily protein n=1 Tax=Linum tenue TaxID=586396 RepID=A0AAV0HXW8_9ROSI|nr:unnamed protein product [Linum tenue]